MKKISLLIAVPVMFSLVLACLFPQTANGNAYQTGSASNILYLSLQINPEYETIDPSLAYFVQEINVINALFAGLVKVDAEGNVLPDLAESWAWNLEKTEITFTLRSGLLWSDGQPITAADARYALLREINPSLNAEYASFLDPIVNAYEYRTGTISNPDLVGVYADDATHLRIQLDNPMIFFDKILAMWFARPLPQHVISLHPTDWTKPANIVTSGPYQLMGWTASRMELHANPNYYAQPASFNQIILKGSNGGEWSDYMEGNLDTIDLLSNQYQQAQADPVLAPQSTMTAGACSYGLIFKTDSAPFNNVNVRKALIAAIDRDDYITQTYSVRGYPTQTWTPPTISGYVDGPAKDVGIPFNVSQAQTYLANAGYSGGAGFPATTIYAADTSLTRTRWNYLKNTWKTNLNITININFVLPPPSTKQPIILGSWCADYNDAYNFVWDGVQVYKTSGRLGNWTNSTYDSLINQILQESSQTTRFGLYEQVEKILVEDDAVIGPLYNSAALSLTKPYLQRAKPFAGYEYWDEWTLDLDASVEYDYTNPVNFTTGVDATQYAFPASMYSQQMVFTHTVLRPDESAILPPAGLGSIGHAYILTTAPKSSGADAQDQTPVSYTVTITYSPEQVAVARIIDENSLGLYAWVNGAWVLQNTTVSTLTHQITAVTSLINTQFAVFAPAIQDIFLPAIIN